jgi:nickel transport protein
MQRYAAALAVLISGKPVSGAAVAVDHKVIGDTDSAGREPRGGRGRTRGEPVVRGREVIRRVALALALAAPIAASAHEVLHSVERGRAVAVHAWHPDGEDLAYCAFEVFSPADPEVPHQKGRTDRRGWLAFVPDAPGKWRVKVVDGTGHGLELEVDGRAPAPSSPPATTAAFVLRPIAGIITIGAAFAALFTLHRRKNRAR